MLNRGDPTEPRNKRRRWLFRLAAVAMGLALFALLELVLVPFEIAGVEELDDPFVGFDGVRPLFVLDETGTRYEIPRGRHKFFAPASFPARKGPNTYRVFCLGGSTVQGRPYSTDTSFPTWLELSLSAAAPNQTCEVINCGGISYASYRLVPILQECLAYEPDLLIICTGHNEFLEERTYGSIKQTSPALMTAERLASKLSTYRLLRAGYHSLYSPTTSSDKPSLSTETQALLDYKDGIAAYHRDLEFRDVVVAHFEHNLRRMIAIADGQRVPIVLVKPPSNLADCPPFKSEHREDLTAAELSQWEALVRQAKAHYSDDLSKSIRLFREAIAIDEVYAATHFELGRCLLLTGEVGAARESFLQARELDVCPLRMIVDLQQRLGDAATDTRTPLVDAAALLEPECRQGIMGDDILVDHVHPKYRGHQLIADELTQVMIEQGWLAPTALDWQANRRLAYQEHFNSLEPIYFARGLRELKALRAWAAGRADGPERGK